MHNKFLQEWKEKLASAASLSLIAAETVSEADIDIAMGIVINTDSKFRSWLISHVCGNSSEGHDHLGARWGVWTESGESDLVWFVIIGGERKAILIENKINAGPQPMQYERYCKRAEVWKKADMIDDAVIVLICPGSYQSSESTNYIRVNYEVILQWLEEDPDKGARRELGRLLSLGLNKPQQGWAWTVKTDNQILDWYRWLWNLRDSNYPNLWLIGNCPTGKNGKVSTWHTYPFSRGSLKYSLNLKLGERAKGGGWGSTNAFSAVDLEIKNTASRYDGLRTALMTMVAGTALKIITAGKSIAIRKDVPLVRGKVLEEGPALQALGAAQELQDWFEKHENAISDLLTSH